MLEKWFNKVKGPQNKKGLTGVLLLLLLGLGITFFPISPRETPTKAVVTPSSEAAKEPLTYEEALEKRLTIILQKMEGVGQVNVMITTVSDKEKILAEEKTQSHQKQQETDQGGGTRITEKEDMQNKIILQTGNVPYVIKENKPIIKGVLVIAEGAENSEVKSNIIQSVTSLLDVPVHKVAVYKKGK
ncbi:hypothetical protein CS063_02460 [Sporanaerobium hydrogeniformans]|uniref:Uncharacterized protein n=1 Tax=Sporanaerobium hydrogeniformans TaxID=3072179 RepID=A0AC61DG85_9FIRM|nr:hypothetical protein [Sporanaerobium hydrogeniformans]PHV72360.1 hypothetical protein CS063_02460 [Sporanaerobium hydrogeniformans]